MQNSHDSDDGALVVLSGGQDSTTCLYWAFEKFGAERVAAVSFDYAQRHKVELQSAAQICALSGTPHHILPINTFSALGGNALTADIPVDQYSGEESTRLPNTFVPGRNVIFLSYAAALAFQLNYHHLVTGVAQTDYSGYPDCRENTLKSLQQTLSLGMDYALTIHTPLMHLSKKQTVQLAQQLNALPALGLSHTCYNGIRPGCGECPACVLRAKGFAEAGIADPLFSQNSG